MISIEDLTFAIYCTIIVLLFLIFLRLYFLKRVEIKESLVHNRIYDEFRRTFKENENDTETFIDKCILRKEYAFIIPRVLPYLENQFEFLKRIPINFFNQKIVDDIIKLCCSSEEDLNVSIIKYFYEAGFSYSQKEITINSVAFYNFFFEQDRNVIEANVNNILESNSRFERNDVVDKIMENYLDLAKSDKFSTVLEKSILDTILNRDPNFFENVEDNTLVPKDLEVLKTLVAYGYASKSYFVRFLRTEFFQTHYTFFNVDDFTRSVLNGRFYMDFDDFVFMMSRYTSESFDFKTEDLIDFLQNKDSDYFEHFNEVSNDFMFMISSKSNEEKAEILNVIYDSQ